MNEWKQAGELTNGIRNPGRPGAVHRSAVRPARQPPADPRRILRVRVAELTTQPGLFVGDDEQVHDRKPDRPVDRQRSRAGQQHLAEEDRRHAQVHRVAHVAIEPANDEVARRIDGRKRAPPAARELHDTGREQRRPGGNDQHAGEKPGVPLPADAIESEDGPRHVAGNDAGEQDCPEQTAEPEHASILRSPGERRCAEGYPGALETCHSRGVCPAQHAKRSKRVPAARLAGAAFHLEVHRTRMRVLERPAPEAVAPCWAWTRSRRAGRAPRIVVQRVANAPHSIW